ncbi:MAG: hypothetical protein NT151_12725 [Acidobacteria bacterium]|nr:hypothetical protein [Acidobacteriota bacterium]
MTFRPKNLTAETHPCGVVAFLVLAATLVAACARSPSAPSTGESPFEQLAEKLATAHFRMLADRSDAATLRAVADALESAYPRVTTDLHTGDLPVVAAWIWVDAASFYDAMRGNIGQTYPGSRGYVFGVRNLGVLADATVARHATHEFVHVVSLAVNATIGNNPRWLWETVALYENGEFVNPASLDYMLAGRYPTLAALDADFNTSRQIYEVGYLLGEFIVSEWGLPGLVGLIRENGNLARALGVTTEAFEARWYAFLRSKYGLP